MLIRISKFVLATCIVVCGLASSGLAQEATKIADVKHEGPVDFEKEILPIFRRNCLACHNSSKHENDLILENPTAIAKGGASGASIVAGRGLESYLLKVAAHQEEPVMPPAGNTVGAKKLSPEELGLLKLWIDQGGTGTVSGPKPIVWQALPEKFRPIYATAVTADGQYAAAARANQIFVHHLASKRDLGRLTDPALIASGAYKNPGVAHLDFVESLAFSPSGDRLASGSFRTISLWKKQISPAQVGFEEAPAGVTATATSRDGQMVVMADGAGGISVYAASGGKPMRKISSPGGAVSALDISPDGKELLAIQAEKVCHVYKVEDGSALVHIPLVTPAKSGVFTSSGARVVLGFEDGSMRVYDRATLPVDAAAAPESVIVQKEIKLPPGSFGALAALAGDEVASAGQDGNLRITNVVNGETPHTIGHGAPVTSLAVQSLGAHFVTLGGGATKLWRLSDKKMVAELKGDFRSQNAVSASERVVGKADQAVNNSKADLAQSEKEKKDEEENLKKATEAKGKAEMELAQKKEAAKKPLEEKTAADAAAAQLAAAQTESMKAKEAADQVATKAESAVPPLEAAAKTAIDALTQAQNVAKEALANLEKAKAALTAAPEDTAAKDAVAKAEAALAEAMAKEKTAAEANAAAAKVVADAQAAMKAAKDAKAAAEAALSKAMQDAKAAMEKAKQLEGPANKAKDEVMSAERGLETTNRSVERGKESLDRATKAVPTAQQVVAEKEENRKQRGAELEEVKKQLTASDKPMILAAFTRDGHSIVTVTETGDFFTWDVATGAALEVISSSIAGAKALLATTDDRIAVCGADGKSRVQGVNVSWTLERTIGGVEKPDILIDRVLALDFSPDGKLLASGGGEPSRSGELKIWNIENGELVKAVPEAHSDTINSVAFSPDGASLATCGSDRFAKIFSVSEGKLIRPLEGHTHYVLGVTWRSDGRMVATSGADSVIKVWDARTGDQVRTIQGYAKEVNSVRYMGLTDHVVTTSGDNAVRMKNSGNGSGVRDLGGATDYMFSLGVSADGKTIVAGGQDGVLRVWNDQGQSLATFEAPK